MEVRDGTLPRVGGGCGVRGVRMPGLGTVSLLAGQVYDFSYLVEGFARHGQARPLRTRLTSLVGDCFIPRFREAMAAPATPA